MARLVDIWNRALGRPAERPPVVDRRRMNEDWKPGDLAVCIGDDFSPRQPHNPAVGDMLRVREILDLSSQGVRAYFLGFEGKPGDSAWECTGFRKIHPTAEPADAEFVAEVKRRARPKVDA